MSTKTTFKRIALVAVAALGLGVVSSVAPASAAPTTQTYTKTLSPDTTSITRVGGTASTSGAAIFKLRTFDESGVSSPLFATESITVSVFAVPAIDTKTVSVNASDIAYAGVTTATTADLVANAGTYAVSTTAVTDGTALTLTAANATEFNSHDAADEASTNVLATYGLAVYPTAAAVDKGYYTLRLRLQDTNGLITDQFIKVQFVTSPADAGAVLTITKSGTITSGSVLGVAKLGSLTATLKDANGGLIQRDLAAGAAAYDISAPALSASIINSSTEATVDALVASDNGVAATDGSAADHVASATATAAQLADQASLKALDGVYGLTKSTALAAVETSTFNTVRVVYGSKVATLALTVANAASQTATPVVTFTGAGALSSSTPFNLPLTTKTASFKVTGATPGKSYSYSVAWTLVAAGDQTPLAATPTVVYADAAGSITVPVTNSTPIDGAKAVVTISGFTANPAAQTINWVKSKAATISVDMNGAYVALKSTNVFTATVTDSFGAPVAGFLLTPSLSSTSSNYSATATYATLTTDAAGKATFSVTDALAIAAGTDKVTFTSVDASVTAAASTITYAATAPAPTALAAYYSATPATSSSDVAITTAVPAGGIYVDGISTKFPIQKARNNSVATAVADSIDQLRVRISTGVTGAKVTAAGTEGVYFLNGTTNFQTATSTKYSGTTGYTASFIIGSSKTGANTVTFTSGTVTTTVAFWVGNTANDARFVTLTQAAAAGPVVAQVTDRYGNGISGASVQISTSAGTLGNGQMTTVYTTDLSGSVSVLPTGADSAVITAIATNTAGQHADAAGFAGTAAIDASVKAGNSTATLTVTPVASASDVAQTATDAAAEATDAANAATDAANAAAEAADAATAAAQDAADAVAALSTQVSEMVNALKKQITALTNLVIKIQKKVRA
jgi:hypothetical protein